MYVNDPHEKAALPEVVSDLEFEEARDYHEFFYDDLPQPGGKYTGYHWGFHTDICRFDEQGRHTQMADNCPHFDLEDEEGKRILPGWTVQQR